MIMDKINQIFDDVARERNEFEESYQELPNSKTNKSTIVHDATSAVSIQQSLASVHESSKKLKDVLPQT